MNRRIKEVIAFPVRYDEYGQKIMDAKNQMVADVRGWGRIQYMNDAEARQDEMGRFIADAINHRLSNSNSEAKND